MELKNLIQTLGGLTNGDALKYLATKVDLQDATIQASKTFFGNNFKMTSQPFDTLRIGLEDLLETMKIAGRKKKITAYDVARTSADASAGYASVAGIIGFILKVSPTDSTQPNVSVTVDTGVTEIVAFEGVGSAFVPARAQATYDTYAPSGLTTSAEDNILEFTGTGQCEVTVSANAQVFIKPVVATAENITVLLNATLNGTLDKLPALYQ